MTLDEQDPRSGQGRGSDEVVYDFNLDDTEASPNIQSRLWDGDYPSIRVRDWRWNNWTLHSNQAEWCGAPVIRLISHLDGIPWSAPYKCRSWTHRECAEEAAARIVTLLERRFRGLEGVWYTVFQGSKKARDRLRQRRKGASDGWVSIRRTARWVAYFSTHKRPGRAEPSEWVFLPPDVALFVAADFALLQPGVERVDWSKTWRPKSWAKDHESTNQGYGVRGDGLWTAAVEDARDILVDLHGEKWNPWDGTLPKGISIPEWTGLVAEQVRHLSETSRLGHGQEKPHGWPT